jgi:predicted metal-dependent phosphoesterase TrpH
MDCATSLDEIITSCQQLDIGCVAIADHGTIEGALQLIDIAPFKVIVAEEILTPDGEIMGLFLKETIPSGISTDEAVAAIRAQGGLVGIPHPFDSLRSSALDSQVLNEMVSRGQVDALEVLNSRTIMGRDLAMAKLFAEKHCLIKTAGSDAHSPSEIGHAYIEMPQFEGRDDFLEAVARGNVYGGRSSPFVHFRSLANKLRKRRQ